MNEEKIQKVYETIEDTLQDIMRNETYINKKRYFGLNGDLLQYIRNLEQALDEIEKKYCNYYGTTEEQNGDFVLRNVLKEILQIIKKAKGE